MSGVATVAEAETMQGLTWAQQHSLQMSNLSATETSAEPLIWHNIPQSDQLSTWGQVDYITPFILGGLSVHPHRERELFWYGFAFPDHRAPISITLGTLPDAKAKNSTQHSIPLGRQQGSY